MSVFQLQDWWSVKLSDREEFDHGCMFIGNIDNANPPTDKICVGSFQGILRVYNPSRPQFRVEDLILEEDVGLPILQVLGGRFIPSTELLGIALLHPRKLAVYEIVPQGAKEGRVTHHTLNKLYHHELGIEGKHFTAYNMTAGGFGGVRGRDMFIVQSMDGKVQILEQSANAFSRQLIDCLIPGPIAYVPKLDSFVTVNHAGQAECYRYQVLASSQTDLGSKDTGNDAKSRLNTGSFGITTVRSALVEWKVDLGEPCRQIIEGCFSTATVDYNRTVSELIFVCDKSLFLIKAESGGVIQQKRLERSDASCICPYPVATNSGAKSTNFLLASQDSTIQVYSAFNLVWAAKTTSVPVQMAVTSFGSQKGLVTSIDDSGLLSISYLGTRPPVNAVTSHVREMDYEKIDEEHRSLLQIIRESQNENKVEPTERLLMRSQLPKTLDMDHMDVALPKNLVPVYQTVAGMSNDHNVVKVCVRIYLTYTGDKPATDVSIAVSVPNFIHVVPKHVVMQKVAGVKSTPAMVKFYFYTIKDFAASTFDACVTASYQSSKGEPRVATHTFQLPIFLAARPKPPVTQGVSAKLTLDTEYPAQPLTDLFDDFLYAAQESGIELTDALGNNATQAMGFQLLSSNGTEPVTVVGGNQNPVVSVLVSKNAGRYRIQSSTYTALLPIVLELERRLISKIEDLSASSGKPVKADAIVTGMKGLVTCADPLPVEEYFQVISSHHKTRKTIALLNSQLNDYAHQFRLVQKRLLVRFKDRNPTPLAGLDFLLNETYKKLVEIGDSIENHQKILRQQTADIECFSRLIAVMAAMKYNMSKIDRDIFQAHLCPAIKESSEQGWEETMDASITYLLKTSLAKNVKESAHLTGTTLEMPPSIDNLKKHFQMVVDRLEKGGRVSTTLPATPSGPPVAVSTVSNKAPINGMTGTTSPAGSKKVKGAKRQSN